MVRVNARKKGLSSLVQLYDLVGNILGASKVRYDPRIDRLVEFPIAELEQLRSPSAVANVSAVPLVPDAPAITVVAGHGLTLDVELEIAIPLPPASATVKLGAACDTEACDNGLWFLLNVSSTTQAGLRDATLQMRFPG